MQGVSMVIYIRLSCCEGKGDENHDLRDLLAGADGVTGVAIDLADTEPAEKCDRQTGCGQHNHDRHKGQGVQREEHEQQEAGRQRDVALACPRLPGGGGDAGGFCSRQRLPVPHHQGAAHHQCGDQAGGGGPGGQGLDQRCKCRCAQREGQDDGDRAIAADATVLHDVKRSGPVLAAAETVGHVGQPVFMQRAGDEGGDGDGEPAGKLG